jgi:hypothetical protein
LMGTHWVLEENMMGTKEKWKKLKRKKKGTLSLMLSLPIGCMISGVMPWMKIKLPVLTCVRTGSENGFKRNKIKSENQVRSDPLSQVRVSGCRRHKKSVQAIRKKLQASNLIMFLCRME